MNHYRGINVTVLTVCILMVLLSGCGWIFSHVNPNIARLEELKTHHSNADYQWIAQQQIDCQPSDEGCNQQHLIKGDACFRLAKEADANNEEAKVHYECAAKHLQAGIQQTISWQIEGLDLNRAQTYTNLCESLRRWRDLETDDDLADEVADQLLETSQRFLQEEPNNLAAIYFMNGASFDKLSDEVFGNPPDPDRLCEQLTQILNAIDQAIPRAASTPYKTNYERLRSDVAGTRDALGCQ